MFVGEGANGDEEEDEHLSLQTHHHCPPKIPEFIRNVGPKGRLDFAKLFVNNLNTTKVTLYEKMKEWADEYDVRVSKFQLTSTGPGPSKTGVEIVSQTKTQRFSHMSCSGFKSIHTKLVQSVCHPRF